MASATSTIRVPRSVQSEVSTASRLLGCNAAELLQRAWLAYRETTEFRDDFQRAQKAFATGDLEHLASRFQERSEERAWQRTQAVEALRAP